MIRFIVLTFLFLGWGFWELSGGSDFVPESRSAALTAEAEAEDRDEDPQVLVTRASTMSSRLAIEPETRAEPEAEIVPASLGTPARTTPAVPAPEQTAPRTAPEVVLFESLVEGAPTVADILPDTEIAVILPEGTPAPRTASAPAVSGDMRQVAGSRVNMRAGPGTNYGVVTTLSRGADVEVFEVNASGWARLRNVATGQEGWMAERLLTGG